MISFKLSNQSDLELAHVFECGQCFRWKKEDDGSYIGVIKDGVVRINKVGDNFIIKSSIENEDEIREYLDLNTNYGEIKNIISKD